MEGTGVERRDMYVCVKGKGKRGKEKGEGTFPADHLVAIILGRQGLKGGFDDTAAETEDEVEG